MDLGVKSTSLADIISQVQSSYYTSIKLHNNSKTKTKDKNKDKDENNKDNLCNLDFSSFITIYSSNVGLVQTSSSSSFNIKDQNQMWIPTNSGLWIKVIFKKKFFSFI